MSKKEKIPVDRIKYVEDIEDFLKDLGFVKCDWQRNDSPVFSRRGTHEVSLVEKDDKNRWCLTIDPVVHHKPSLENARIMSYQSEIIDSKKNILTMLCKWYMLRGEYNIKNKVHLIENEKSSKLHDLVWIDNQDDKIVFEVIT